ncbi:MAG: CBS domain-containing protein, partial [Thaumarchaeota archaeon]|nr:CBS domain-containing protein [Nitrososphaerota archaeon]
YHDLRKIKRERWNELKVKDVMTPKSDLITMKEDDRAKNAISLMNGKRIGRVFVVDEIGKLKGIITRTDILRAVQTQEMSLKSQGVIESVEGLKRTFVAEKGMYFVIEQELPSAQDLTAQFDTTKLKLVDAKFTESDGRKMKQFVFEVLETGFQTVILKPVARATTVGNPI